MKIAFVTCYYGEERHVQMTERWYTGLMESITYAQNLYPDVECSVYLLNNGAVRPAIVPGAHWHSQKEENMGFANGMAEGVITARSDGPQDYYAILNNDLQFDNVNWLAWLIYHARSGTTKDIQTLLPLMPNHNRSDFKSDEAMMDHEPKNLGWGSCPAVCWFMPDHQVYFLATHYRTPGVFHRDFKIGWYEDVLVEKLLFAHYEHPFKIIYQSWINHLGSQTSDDKKLFDGDFSYRDIAKSIYLRLMKKYMLHERIRQLDRDPFFEFLKMPDSKLTKVAQPPIDPPR
jgi:hypothetical protein